MRGGLRGPPILVNCCPERPPRKCRLPRQPPQTLQKAAEGKAFTTEEGPVQGAWPGDSAPKSRRAFKRKSERSARSTPTPPNPAPTTQPRGVLPVVERTHSEVSPGARELEGRVEKAQRPASVTSRELVRGRQQDAPARLQGIHDLPDVPLHVLHVRHLTQIGGGAP